jgi:hypothetical protein
MRKTTTCLFALAAAMLLTGCVSPLESAAGRNDIKAVNELLDQGATVNEKNRLNGETALKAAILQGNVAMVKLLLDRGADVNLASGNMGWTALSDAAYHGNTEVAMLLIGRGADINKAIAGLRRGFGTGNAVEFLNELKYKKATPPHGPDSPPSVPTTLPPPAEQATPF